MAARRLATALWRCTRTAAAVSGSIPAATHSQPACLASLLTQPACGAGCSQWRFFSLAALQQAASGGHLYGGQTLEEIRSRIFGTHIGNGLPSGRKLLRKKLVGEKIASYYEVPIGKTDPLFESLDDERCVFCDRSSWLMAGTYMRSCACASYARCAGITGGG